METVLLELPTIVSVAFEVLTNKYGVGVDRRKALEHAGFDYDEVQSCVNELVALFKKYGD